MPGTTPLGQVTACQICGSRELTPILSLGHQPPVHAHLTAAQLHQPESTYPLAMCRCERCGLAQLDYIVDPTIVFPPEYPYQTGLTNMLVKNFRSLAEELGAAFNLSATDLVVDIGSNDGTLLQGFKDRGAKVLGVEPTNVAQLAVQRGIPTVQQYFNTTVAAEMVAERGQASVVTCTNAFAHINDVFEVLAGIALLLKDDGVFVSESQYLLDMVEKLEVDTIYHEHLRFYSLAPLQTLFARAGFTLVDAERIAAAGGSIRVYAKKGIHEVSARVGALLAAEHAAGIDTSAGLKAWAERVIQAKQALVALLIECKKKGRIVGLGAPARASSLLGFAHIDPQLLDYAVEKEGSQKIGLFTPGTHIPIVSEAQLFSDQPEFLLVLSWHIGLELMKKVRSLGYTGQFIMPLPEPRIVSEI